MTRAMKCLLLLCAAAVTVLPAAAATFKIHIVAPWRAGQYQGSVVAVHGRAEVQPDSILQGKQVRIIGEDGRVQFIGYIPKLNEYTFPDVEALSGREVVMYGVIEMYRAVPATQLTYRSQLQPWPVPPRS